MDPSPRSLSVIFLEDSESDIEIVYQKLADGFGCPVHMDSAETEREFLGLIRNKKYDLILADYTLPGYNAPEALRQCLTLCPDAPFIVVSGTIGEDAAVEMLKRGAADYVLKDRLERLPFAALRAMESAKNDAEKKRTETELRRAKERMEEAERVAHVGSVEWDAVNNIVVWSDEAYRICGLDKDVALKIGYCGPLMDKTDRDRVYEAWEKGVREKSKYDIFYWITIPDGTRKCIHFINTPKVGADGTLLAMTGTLQDITERKLTELETIRVKESLQEAQRIAHIGSWDWDIANDKLYWSDESFRLLGMEPTGEPISSGLHLMRMDTADRKRVLEARKRALISRKPLDVTYPVETMDGKKKYIHSLGRAQYNEAGAPVYMSGTMQDITKQKLAEMEISRIKEGLEEAQRIAHIGSCSWTAADDTAEWSGELFRIFGLDSHTVKIRRGTSYDFMVEQDIPVVSAVISAAARDIKPFDVNFWITRPDGGRRYIHFRGDMKADSRGRLSSMSGTMQDITERKLAENALQLLSDSYKLMLNSTSDGVAMYDRDGMILNTNKVFAARFGKTVQETMGMRIEDCLPAKRYETLYQKRLELLRKCFDSGEIVNFEDSRDGLLFLNRYHPVYKNGKVVAVTLFSTDITVQKRAEEEARKRAEAEARVNVMTEFFTNVSHELKTPLSLILMQMESMRMHLDEEKRMIKLLDESTLNAYRLTRLVNNLLDIVKMDSGFMTLNLRKRNIVDTIRNICESVSGYAAAKSILLEFDCNVKERQMDMDRDKLDRIVLNLLSNAIKHTPESGRITVVLEDKLASVMIRVRDTGEGIPADKLDSIFDRFVQVNNRMSRQAEGCGIGLALVKSMVELHGGRVWAQSEAGKGSEFIVELPAKVSEAPARPEIIEGFELSKKVRMELSDLYISTGS